MIITLDVETLPDMREGVRDAYIAESRANFKAPSDMTKERAMSELGITDKNEIKFTSKDAALQMWANRFAAEKADEVGDAEWRKTSFDGARGQICCIGAAVDDGKVQKFYSQGAPAGEEDILIDFFTWADDMHRADNMRQAVLVGHNIASFDLRFIFQRAVINGVRPPVFWPRNAKPWSECVFDTMTEWAGHNGRISLDKLCDALGIEGKSGMDGSMVCDEVMAGRIADVSEYCAHDVEITRKCYERMTFYRPF